MSYLNRQQSNRALLRALELILETNPDLRFGQALEAFDFVKTKEIMVSGEYCWNRDIHLEPEQLLKRVMRSAAWTTTTK